MEKQWIVLGCAFALSAVALGAFGAHALRNMLQAESLAIFETGVRYQMYHALGLLAVGALAPHLTSPPVAVSGWLFTIGIVIFSGSLYALSWSGIGILGAITPFGGVCLLAGWGALLISALRS